MTSSIIFDLQGTITLPKDVQTHFKLAVSLNHFRERTFKLLFENVQSNCLASVLGCNDSKLAWLGTFKQSSGHLRHIVCVFKDLDSINVSLKCRLLLISKYVSRQ